MNQISYIVKICLISTMIINSSFKAADIYAQNKPHRISNAITGNESSPHNFSPVAKNSKIVSNNFPPKITQSASITYSPTGVRSIYDFQSNSVPEEIWQDPLNPANVHVVYMYANSNDPTYANRKCRYIFSSNYAQTWFSVTNVSNASQTGFPMISGFNNGRAIIGLNFTTSGLQESRIFYNMLPGSNNFSELIPHGSQILPKVLGIQNNEIIFSGCNNSTAFTNTAINISPPGTFTGWNTYPGGSEGNYSFAKAYDGKIGQAYIGNLTDPNNFHDVFYRVSTDNGLTWSSPVKIWNWDPLADSLGCLNGVSIVYGNNNEPFVTFNISKLGDTVFFPDLPSFIKIWSPVINGGIPVTIADSNSVPFFPNKGNTSDNFFPLCRPAIGSSFDGSILAVAFSATTEFYSYLTDSSSYFSSYICLSTNGGNSWSDPGKITPEMPLRDWRYVSISKGINASGNTIDVQMVCQSDSIAGSHVSGGSNIGIAELVGIRYQTFTNGVPFAPILITPSNGDSGVLPNPLLDWSNSTNSNSFRVQVSKNPGFSTAIFDISGLTQSQFQIPVNLEFDSMYYWRVSVTNANGTSAWSTVFSFNITSNLPVPPNLNTPVNGSTNVILNPYLDWYEGFNATSFNVQLSTDTGFTSTLIDEYTIPSFYGIPFSRLNYNTIYYWRVRGINVFGSGLWSETWNFRTRSSFPDPPVLVSPPDESVNISLHPLLNWDTVEIATLYRVQISIDSNFLKPIYDRSFINTQTLVADSLLVYNTKYFWRVNGFNSFGSGPWSLPNNFRTVPYPIPGAPTLNFPLNNFSFVEVTPLLDWSTITTAEMYRLNIATDLYFNNMVLDSDTIHLSEFRVPQNVLNHNVLYFWRVNAMNSSGVGPWSLTWVFRTGFTGIELFTAEIPNEYKLYNNYPNPFNPSTNIRFDIPKTSFVSVKIYDFIGREVAILVNENLPAGSYVTKFDEKNLSSGVYFYRIHADNFTQTQRMILLK